MRFFVPLLWFVLSCSFATSSAGGQAPAQEPGSPKYWAGIITQRPTNESQETVYLVPKVEVVDGVKTVRRDAQSTRPVQVRRIMVDSPASQSGLQPGDLIIKFNDVSVTTHPELVAAIQTNGDQMATILISRGGEEQSIKLRPIARPSDYAERVRADREAEAAEMTTAQANPNSEVVAIPGKLSALLALAAQDQSEPTAPEQESLNPAASLDPPGDVKLPADANFDRSTQILIEKLEQFTREWTELLEQQKRSLQSLNGLR